MVYTLVFFLPAVGMQLLQPLIELGAVGGIVFPPFPPPRCGHLSGALYTGAWLTPSWCHIDSENTVYFCDVASLEETQLLQSVDRFLQDSAVTTREV